MNNKTHIVVSTLIVIVCLVSWMGVAQQTPSDTAAEQTKSMAESAGEQALTYIDSVATYLGQGVVYVLNLITDDRVSPDLEKPIGYLTFITLILLLFGLLDFARRIIWIAIIVGWALLIIRIVLDALNV